MRFFSLLFRILGVLGLLLLSLPVLLIMMSFSADPLVTDESGLSAAELDTMQQLLIDNDPRLLLEGEQTSINLREGEANTLLKYLISETPPLQPLRARVSMEDGKAEVRLTRPVEHNLLGDFLNIRIGFNENNHPVHIAYITIGNIELPDYVIGPVLNWAQRRYGKEPNYQLLLSIINTVDSVDLEQEQATVHVEWDGEGLNELGNQARDILIAAPAQTLIVHYYELIMATEAEMLAEHDDRLRRSLNRMLRSLFSEAYQRTIDSADPVLENQALLIALAVYTSDLNLEQVAQIDESFPEPKLTLILNKRPDLALHVALSAAVSATASPRIIETVSVYKEIYDARYRTGFSFDDMMANQVGSALGEIARRDQSTAHRLQHMLKDIEEETDYMPSTTTGETMTEAEFQERYGSRQSDLYRRELDKMEIDISERPLFQAFNTTIIIN